jgi:hypothetical protein
LEEEILTKTSNTIQTLFSVTESLILGAQEDSPPTSLILKE